LAAGIFLVVSLAESYSARDTVRSVSGMPAAGITAGTTDPNAHADKEQSFDVESPPVRISGEGADAATARSDARSASAEGKLDTVLHRVESRENFWTISRMYYNSGRYYRALWKANADKVPEITKLHQGTVVRIPPPEELDPAYIDPPGTRPGSSSSRPDGEILSGTTARPTIPPPRAPIRPRPAARPTPPPAAVCPSAAPAGWTSS
jgi:hypothetical protein